MRTRDILTDKFGILDRGRGDNEEDADIMMMSIGLFELVFIFMYLGDYIKLE